MGLVLADFLSDAQLDGAYDVYVKGDYAYVACSGSDRLVILDVSDPTNISIKGSLQDATNLNQAHAVCVVGDYAYVAFTKLISGYYYNYFSIIEVSDKENPTYVSSSSASFGSDGLITKMLVVDDYFIIFSASKATSNYFYIWELSDPDAYNIFAQRTEAAFNNWDGIDLAPSGKIVGVTSDDKIVVVDGSGYTRDFIKSICHDANLSSVQKIDCDESYVYLAGGYYFKIYSIVDPENPMLVGSLYDTTNFLGAHSVKVIGNYAYVVGTKGVTSVNISNKANPTAVSVFSDTRTKTNVIFSGDYVYYTKVFDTYNELRIVDISNPSSMSLKGSLNIGSSGISGYNNDVLFRAYVFGGSPYLSAIDVSNKAAPALIAGSSITNASFAGMGHAVFSGNYAFFPCSSANSIAIVDISSPTSMSVYGTISSAKTVSVNALGLEGTKLYSAGTYLCRYDISNLASITLEKSIFCSSGQPNLSTDLIVCGRADGFVVFQKDEFPDSTGDTLGTATDATLLNNPTAVSVNASDIAAVATADRISFFDISSPAVIALSDYILDAKTTAVQDIFMIGDYAIAITTTGTYALVGLHAPPSSALVDSIQDAVSFNGVRRFFRKGVYLYCAIFTGDGLAVIDASGYIPADIGFVPKIMII